MHELLDGSKWDEQICLQREEHFNNMAFEMQAQCMGSKKKVAAEPPCNFFVCALCKMGYACKYKTPNSEFGQV